MPDAEPSRGPVLWRDRLPWLILLRAFRPAVSLRMLLCAAAGLLVMIAGWRLCWLMFSGNKTDPLLQSLRTSVSASYDIPADQVVWPVWPWQKTAYVHFGEEGILASELAADSRGELYFDPRVTGPRRLTIPPSATNPVSSAVPERLIVPWRATMPGRAYGVGSWGRAVVAQAWQITLPFQFIFRGQIGLAGLAFSLLCGLWTLAVWAFFGGAMTRTVALQLTRQETVSWGQVSGFALKHWLDYFTAPLYPLLGVLLATLPVLLLGLFARFDIGALLVSILWPLALLAGLLMALLLLGLFFGWPLMWSTVSVEGNDAFDALSRSYAYVFQRPLHYLFYGLVAAVLGTLAWFLVQYFAEAVIHLSAWAASWGTNNQRIGILMGWPGSKTIDSGTGSYAVLFFAFWNGLVRLIAAGFAISYLWSSTTAIYLLLRRDVDSAEMDEVQLEQDERFGLPPLATDERGVPGVADEAVQPPSDEE